MAVADGRRVEAVGQFVLGFGRGEGLVLEDYYLIVVERITNDGKVIVCGYLLVLC